ncbi:hypothetical protein [Mycolicibacterium sphagni]|uniref:Restriction endonuclease type IV Mrr domain-containing protein n=1 Tax=Mycolicibacterium sphagni TaxID=1786 RepID=A0ABX2JWE1_9MYCO|nr:hypothetical protein [Mycolicibacterium sphagni]NTY60119.1 hypothetical protein [Mycolicibacterium sphagni]
MTENTENDDHMPAFGTGGPGSASGRFLESSLIAAISMVYNAAGADQVQAEFRLGPNHIVDLAVLDSNKPELIEVKNITPQTQKRLSDALAQIHALGNEFQRLYGQTPRLVLFVPGPLANDRIERFAPGNVEIRNSEWLLAEARRYGVEQDVREVLNHVIRTETEGQRMKAKLLRLPPGQHSWVEFQALCADIFDYLFSPPLKKGIRESINADGVDRRDIIMPNYSTQGFWAFMREKYLADYIVIDAKNYRKPIAKPQVLQLANYLSTHGPGKFGILATRAGGNRSSRIVCREQWLIYNKIIVIFDDRDILQMIATKDAGGDPTEVLQQKIEDFRLAI